MILKLSHRQEAGLFLGQILDGGADYMRWILKDEFTLPSRVKNEKEGLSSEGYFTYAFDLAGEDFAWLWRTILGLYCAGRAINPESVFSALGPTPTPEKLTLISCTALMKPDPRLSATH